ncbi:MAG: Ig-like domain-containing protein [Mycobacteriaceae bacterium]
MAMVTSKIVRVGAAAVALGLSLAGPQALGVATADTGDTDAAAAASARPQRVAPRGVGPEARAARVSGAAAAASGARSDVVVRGPRASAARTAVVISAPVAASSDSTPAAAPVVAARVAQVPAAAVSVPAAVVPGRSASSVNADVPSAASSGLGDWAQGVADTVALFQYEVQTVLADPVGSIQAVIDTGVNTVFDTLDQWLSSLPANPITDYLSGALLLVRRSLFDEMPTTDPFTNIRRANGQLEGSLYATDPTGEVPVYTLTDAPDYGSVQINPDGTYVYTPFPIRAVQGTDSFTVDVADPGFDLLDPFSPRVKSVTINICFAGEDCGTDYVDNPRIVNNLTWDRGGAVLEFAYAEIAPTPYAKFYDVPPNYLFPGDTWYINVGLPSGPILFEGFPFQVTMLAPDRLGPTLQPATWIVQFDRGFTRTYAQCETGNCTITPIYKFPTARGTFTQEVRLLD